jgi:hypothetical protein
VISTKRWLGSGWKSRLLKRYSKSELVTIDLNAIS